MLRRCAGGELKPCIRTIYQRGCIACFPKPVEAFPRPRSTERLIRESGASLALRESSASPEKIRASESLDCLRNAFELDPCLLDVLFSVRSTLR